MNASEARGAERAATANFVGQPMVSDSYIERRLSDMAGALLKKMMDQLQQNQKEVYTVEDLVERYGLKPATIKAKILVGEFGDTVNLGAKTRLVTRAGLLAYEAAHTGPAEPRHTSTPPRRAKKNRENPGKI